MARATFTAEVLTPEGAVFKDEVEMVSTRTETGSIGILAHHQPLLGLLAPTELRLYRTETDVVRFAQAEGYVQVTPDGVLLLVEEAIAPEDLDAGTLRERVQEAERDAQAADEGTEALAKAQRDKKRAEAFLSVLES